MGNHIAAIWDASVGSMTIDKLSDSNELNTYITTGNVSDVANAECAVSKQELDLGLDLETEPITFTVKHSTIRGAGDGLFVRNQAIEPKQIFGVWHKIIMQANDPMFSIGSLGQCQSSVELYSQLHWLRHRYHNDTSGTQSINVIPLYNGGETLAMASKKIRINEEILCRYGFSSWLDIGGALAGDVLLSCLNIRNIVGFIQYLQEWTSDADNQYDPAFENINRTLWHLTDQFGIIIDPERSDHLTYDRSITPEVWDRHCADHKLSGHSKFYARLSSILEASSDDDMIVVDVDV
jgi:hypothetical protein